MNIVSIIKNATEINSQDFVEIVENAIELLKDETGKTRNLRITDRLVKLNASEEALVVGDLHGDLKSLKTILENSNFTQRMTENSKAMLIFLGDYGDRGAYSAEVYYTILRLKLTFPDQIVLLRGNHEGPEDLMAIPHDLPMSFQNRLKPNWRKAYSTIRKLFNLLYNAALVEERYLMVHGGLSPKINSEMDIAHAGTTFSSKKILEDLLWSDPDETIQETSPSPRGAGRLFGKSITEKILKKLKVKILIRGHEPCEEGYRFNHDGKVLTLFSRKGPPYFNSKGAYLQLQLSKQIDNLEQLTKGIHNF